MIIECLLQLGWWIDEFGLQRQFAFIVTLLTLFLRDDGVHVELVRLPEIIKLRVFPISLCLRGEIEDVSDSLLLLRNLGVSRRWLLQGALHHGGQVGGG